MAKEKTIYSMEIIKVNHKDHTDYRLDIWDNIEKLKDLYEIFVVLNEESASYLTEISKEKKDNMEKDRN